ncbi:GalNAc-alpha-(1-_4)-GalNAc-alpha-(1-_3)-diNAcBac-PP-undecaprenol alpha-1,4-N-acetyl-D-galactosaminyltransferase [Aeromonas rivipollensis]|uniref:glycosyltransferase family 4 protein n=1 Tax=Aeromonas rivipollensis TaxID=948519 RepID=UPI00399D3413
MAQIKICFFIGNISNAGGTERVTSVIANELLAQGYDVSILSLECGFSPFFELSKDIYVSRLFKKSGRGILRLPMTILKLREFIKDNEIDIIVDVESMLALYTVPALVGLNVRHICWEHFNYNVDLGKRARRFARKLAAYFAHDIITLTDRDKALWLKNARCNARVTTISNPLTITLPSNINKKKEKVFLAVGRLTYQKGFDHLLTAWSAVTKKYPEWRLKIVGDGEDREMLEKLRIDLGISHTTELHPKTNDISLHYQQAAFFVLSSRFEGFGLVLVEAQAFGLPVISFDCDMGPAEIIRHEITGWLCEKNNVNSLSEAMISAINDINNYDRKSVMAVQNSKRFSIESIISQWSRLLTSKKK